MYDDPKAKIQDDEHLSIEDGAFQSEEDTGHNPISIREYVATRLTSLKPPMNSAANPFKLLAMLNAQQWGFLAVSFLAWTWDAFDYFTVSLTVSDLAETFGTSTSDITWGITLVLMFRSIGSIMVGILADRYGRKWYAQITGEVTR
jgi:MFS transporter, SHS family, lactate transporter